MKFKSMMYKTNDIIYGLACIGLVFIAMVGIVGSVVKVLK